MTHHPLHRLVRIVACLSFCVVTVTPVWAQTDPDPVFGATGFQQNRDYFSAGPTEHVDTLTGNVILTYTDLGLAGNAGHDVRFQRTYNANHGIWTFDVSPCIRRRTGVAANQSVSVKATGPTLGTSDRVVFLSTVTGQVVADHGVTPNASATATDTFTMTAPAAGGRYAVQWLAPESATPLAHGPGLVVPGPRGTDLETFYYDTDAIGSVRQITNAEGGVVERRDYTPFGAALDSPSATHPLGFGGKERDATGLDYFGARYFSKDIGRFTVVDPFLDQGAALVTPQRWHRYVYAANNPLRFMDPDGRDAVLVTRADKTQVLLIPVRFTGAAASSDLIAGIVARANGLTTPVAGLSIRVVPTDRPIRGVLNNVEIGRGAGRMCGPTGSCASIDDAYINGTGVLPEATGAHELMHLTGMTDHYGIINGFGVGLPGFENSITGTLNGREVTAKDVDEAMKSPLIKRTVVCGADDRSPECQP